MTMHVSMSVMVFNNVIILLLLWCTVTDHVVIGVVRPVCAIGTFPGNFPALKFHSKAPQSQLYSARYITVLLN